MLTVQQIDTNYSEIPVGQIDGDFDDFIARWDLAVTERDEHTAKCEAEWGNGNGADHFVVTLQ